MEALTTIPRAKMLLVKQALPRNWFLHKNVPHIWPIQPTRGTNRFLRQFKVARRLSFPKKIHEWMTHYYFSRDTDTKHAAVIHPYWYHYVHADISTVQYIYILRTTHS